MSWKNAEISDVNLMSVRGEKVPSAELSPIQRNQMFDVDNHGFPVLTDKNISLISTLFANDAAYSKNKPEFKLDKRSYEEETVELFNGMFSRNRDISAKNVERAVYRVNSDNSTSLPTLSGSKKGNASGKPTQAEIVALMGISDGLVIDDMEDDKKDKKSAKKLNGGSLLTANAIAEMISVGFGENGDENTFKKALLEGQPSLVYKIAHAAEGMVNDAMSQEATQRTAPFLFGKKIDKNNFSFATKFCHHVCKRLDGGIDQYCIYDSVVHEFLPYYACEYLDADTIDKICGSRLEADTPREKYKAVNNKIESWRSYLAQDGIDEGYGYERYRNLYDAVLVAVNKWRDAWKKCSANQTDVIQHFFGKEQYDKLGYADFDRFIWYFFKNQWRKTEARELLKTWGSDCHGATGDFIGR